MIPEAKKIDDVLTEFQDKKIQMAIVIDEHGGVSGIVTIEDLLEEIVGEIQDEHDDQAGSWYTALKSGGYLVAGAAPVKEVNALIELGIPERRDYTTLAGFFLHAYGRLPREKDSLTFGRFRLTVEKMSKRRIAQIEIAPDRPGGPAEP